MIGMNQSMGGGGEGLIGFEEEGGGDWRVGEEDRRRWGSWVVSGDGGKVEREGHSAILLYSCQTKCDS